MNKEEFKNHVISEAKKYIFSQEKNIDVEKLNPIKENVTPSSIMVDDSRISSADIKKLAEEVKKINKKIDLRNPLIFEGDESMVESILGENKSNLRDRELDVDGINKNKHISFQNEGEKDKWNRMLKYNIFSDED